MGDRRLVCVMLGPPQLISSEPLRLAGWEVELAWDLRNADELIAQSSAHVGLIVVPKSASVSWARIDEFLVDHDGLEWVGAFDPDDLALPACRDLVLDHLFDHHSLPIDSHRLGVVLGHAHGHALLRQARASQVRTLGPSPIIGTSAALATVLMHIRRIAKADAPVLITGESGSGKELAAQAIHQGSGRAHAPFIAINCGALQPTLIQSEFFGHAKGSFTGAVRDKRGLFEEAEGGTIFLDEIGDLPLDQQVNLLRFLQEGTITRVGSARPVRVDARVIAATHRDLERAVAAGSFREDLFYRLNVLPLRVPPLRERKGDIELLALHCFDKFSREKSPRLKGFSRGALAVMEAHPWRGNVRELINRVRRAMVMAEGSLIKPADLGLEHDGESPPGEILDDTRVRAERSAIVVSLDRTGRNVTAAASQLGISRMTLYRLMAKHGIGSDN